MTAAEFKAIRKNADLSQAALADLIGKTRDMVARYERNAPIPLLVERFMQDLNQKGHSHE